VHPGRFHRHRLDPTGGEPAGQAVEIRGERAELAHRLGVAIGTHRHVMVVLAAIDAGGIGLNAFEQGRPCRPPSFADACAPGLVLHSRLFNRELAAAAKDRGVRGMNTLLNGITTGVSPSSLTQHPVGHAEGRALMAPMDDRSESWLPPPAALYTSCVSGAPPRGLAVCGAEGARGILDAAIAC